MSCVLNALNNAEPHMRNALSTAEPHVRNAYTKVEPRFRAATDANVHATRAAFEAAYACAFPRSLPHAYNACTTAAMASAHAAAQTAALGVTVAATSARTAGNMLTAPDRASAPIVSGQPPTSDEEDEELKRAVAESLASNANDAELELALAMSLAEAIAAKPDDVPAATPASAQPDACKRTVEAPPTPAGAEDAADEDLARLDGDTDDGASDDGVLVGPSDVAVATVEGTPLGDPFPSTAATEGVEWDEWKHTLLEDLNEMGFRNRALNAELLRKHDGDIKATVRELVEAGQA